MITRTEIKILVLEFHEDGIKFFMMPALVILFIACCVTHLYVLNFIKLSSTTKDAKLFAKDRRELFAILRICSLCVYLLSLAE